MAKGIAQVQVKRQRGKLNVQALGETPRGQRYLKKSIAIDAPKMGDKKFKEQLPAAVEALFA